MTLHTMGDWQLLQAYAENSSEPAFTELVRLHIDWVYSVAIRNVGDPHLAEDVVQSVFVLLARKSRSIRPGTLVGGWLFRTTLHVAAHARRAENRRINRETTACTMIHDTASSTTDEMLWQQLAPHLDQAVAALSAADRSAILLRFYQKAPLRDIGESLGISEEAAKKRVKRALEKMRGFLEGRGVKLGGGLLATVLAGKTVQTASASLSGTVVKTSLAVSSASSATLPRLAHETLRAWRWAKIKLAAGFAMGSLALIFLVANTAGWLGRPATRQVNDFRLADAGAAAPNVKMAPVPAISKRARPPLKTGAIRGLVVNEQGKSVAGAKVWGGFSSQPFAENTTDESGRFALDRVGAPSFVTVTADGFAADQQSFDPTNITGSLVFRLSPSPALKVRVLDESGQGIAGVGAFLSAWWGSRGTLGQDVPQQTDVNGRLQWLSAPKGELQMEFVKSGYRFSRTNRFIANSEEHTIVLHPTVTVTGSVTDAENGLPVASFKFTMGHAQPWNPDDPIPMWDFKSKSGSNGFYKILIEEEQTAYLRIEADAYEIVETKIELTNEVEGVRNFQLKPLSATNSIRGFVLLPDGSPAVGVEVALCTAQVGVMLNGTAFAPGASGNIQPAQKYQFRRTTDEQGAFSFDPKPGAHTVVAVGIAGLGQTRCFDFSQPLEIRLQPWGRIEGSVHTSDGQWSGRKLTWQTTGHLTSWMTLFYQLSTQSDASGNFAFEHVPPGAGRVQIDDGEGFAPILSSAVQVNPGATTQVRIGGVGRTVTGKLLAPAGAEIRDWSNQVSLAELHVEYDSYPLPKDLIGTAAERWKLEFENTEAGHAWLRDQYSYDFKVAADGSFTLPEVLPGRYSLFVNVSQGSLGSGPDSTQRYPGFDPQIAWGGKKITVPEAGADSGLPMDLGEITLTATR